MDNKIKIVFWGTPKFAEDILKRLLEESNLFEILAVVTAPDKPVGRKKILTPPPVKILALKNNILVLQPEKIVEEFKNKLFDIETDIFVVAAYGKILAQDVLNIPKYKSINVHPSCLPKYRGASPIQSSLISGDTETGISIILMDDKMDHGPILVSKEHKILDDDNYTSLANKLADKSADLLIDILPKYIAGRVELVEQKHDESTFCKIIKKEDGLVDLDKMMAEEIYNRWRAFCVWPGVFFKTSLKGKETVVKLLEIEKNNLKTDGGTEVFYTKDKELYLVCGGETLLKIKKLQIEGKNPQSAAEFVNGYLK